MTLCKPKRREKLFSTRSAESNFSFSETKFRDKYSRWMSCEPAVGDYMSQTEKGEGGIYNLANLNVYHYSNNNPLKYKDPDGEASVASVTGAFFKGAWDGLKSDAKGAWNAVCHPIQTVQNIGNAVKNEAQAIVADPIGYAKGKIDGAVQGAKDFASSSPEEKAYALGGVAEKVAVTVAVTKGAEKISNAVKGAKAGNVGNAIQVTKDGVALPPGKKIPSNLVENANRSGSYGKMVDGKFNETLRIDPATAPGKKGHNYSHFHVNGGKEHLTDLNKWPTE